MGAGNPRFAEMEKYEPETYYIEFYDYELDEWDEVLDDIQQGLKAQLEGFKTVTPVTPLEKSVDVDAAGYRSEAYTILESDYATVCITSDSEIEKVVIGIIPLEYERFINECDFNKKFAESVGYPYDDNNVYDQMFWNLSDKEQDELEKKISDSYDRYINEVFEPINKKFKEALLYLWPNSIYFPCGAWTSGKLILETQPTA